VNFEAATLALETGRRKREMGRGRTPTTLDAERLARRQGLADQSYAQALAQFREVVGPAPTDTT
jgi:hypothetical protein